MVLAVAAYNSGRTWPWCGLISKDNRQTRAKFLCVNCGYENTADVVGAIDVLTQEYGLLACEDPVHSGVPGEAGTTEATAQITA